MDKFWIVASILFLIVITVASLKDKRFLLYGYVISLPWFGLYMDLGLTVSLDRILAFLMLAYVIFNIRKLNFPKIYRNILLFIGWAIFITLIFAVFAPVSSYDYSLLRGNYKWISEVFLYILYIVPVVFAAITIKNRKEIRVLGKVLIASISILAILGLIQFVFWRFSGTDLFPIDILQQSIGGGRTALLNFGGAMIMRISSLGGEPKYLAYSLVVGLTIVVVEIIHKGFKPLLIFLSALFASVLLLTFSTQGYILLALNLITLFLVMIFARDRVLFQRSIVFICFTALAIGLFFHYFPGYFDLSKERSSERISNNGDGIFLLEDSNMAVVNFLKDQPTFAISGVGLGNIHIRAHNYIPGYALDYIFVDTFAAKSGALRLISDCGLIGLILFLFAYLTPVDKLRRFKDRAEPEQQFLIISLIILMDFLLSFDGPNYIYLTMAIGYLLLTLRLKEGISKETIQKLSD